MSISRKAAVSLLLAVILFAGFTVISFSGFFDLIETRFYTPSKEQDAAREIQTDARVVENYLGELSEKFTQVLRQDAVRRSFLVDQAETDIYERGSILGNLRDTTRSLERVRFVDAGGVRLHYSTDPKDQLSINDNSVIYRNYSDLEETITLDEAALSPNYDVQIRFDEDGERLIFCLPFYDSIDIFRGIAIFSLSVRAISDKLISAGRVKISDNLTAFARPAGIVIGSPPADQNRMKTAIASIWSFAGENKNIPALHTIDAPARETTLVLSSVQTGQGIFVGRLMDESAFVFPDTMKKLLLASFFLTVFIALFLLSSLKQDNIGIVQNRLKNLLVNLLREYYEVKTDFDWHLWKLSLEHRREEVKAELKRGLKIKKGNRTDISINAFIDKSWDDLLTVLASGGASSAPAKPAAMRTAGEIEEAAEPDPFGEITASEPVEELEELEDIAEPPELPLSEENPQVAPVNAELIPLWKIMNQPPSEQRLDEALKEMAEAEKEPEDEEDEDEDEDDEEAPEEEKDPALKILQDLSEAAEYDPLSGHSNAAIEEKNAETSAVEVSEAAEWDPLSGREFTIVDQNAQAEVTAAEPAEDIDEEAEEAEDTEYPLLKKSADLPVRNAVPRRNDSMTNAALLPLASRGSGNGRLSGHSFGRPFFSSGLSGDIPFLESPGRPLFSKTKVKDGQIIKQRGAVNYIDNSVLKASFEEEAALDPKMKSLVDAVLR